MNALEKRHRLFDIEKTLKAWGNDPHRRNGLFDRPMPTGSFIKNVGFHSDMVKKRYVIARTYSAGVFAGFLKSREGKEVVLTDARRLWQWAGAASLSQLAMEGTKQPAACKFPCVVSEVLLLEVIELLNVSATAQQSIEAVPVWSA